MTHEELFSLADKVGLGFIRHASDKDIEKFEAFAKLVAQRDGASMTIEINSANTVAVDREYYWQPMDTCPRGVKVQLLGAGGVAVYGQYHGKDPWWTHWAPLPVKQKEKKD